MREVSCRLTTQAQRPGPRGRWIATWTRWPGSLQRMVGLSRYAAGVALSRGVAAPVTETALDCPTYLGHTGRGSGIWSHGQILQPVGLKRHKKENAKRGPGLVQPAIALRLRAITSCFQSGIIGALRSMLSLFVRRRFHESKLQWSPDNLAQ